MRTRTKTSLVAAALLLVAASRAHAIQETFTTAGNWTYVTHWSTNVTKGLYVMFNSRNAQSPLVRNVRGIRLSGINGATALRIGMLNVTAH